jgi:immune inhibitor A
MIRKKWFYANCGSVVWVAIVAALLITVLAQGGADEARVEADWPSLAMRPRVQYRMPAREMIEWRLRQAGRISADPTEAEISRAVEEWRFKFAKVSPSWARPEDREQILANEQVWLKGGMQIQAQAATPITAAVLAIPVEFDAVETLTFLRPTSGYTDCITVTETLTGPMHGNIPYPGVDTMQTIDNNTTYYPSTEVADYEKLIFSRTGITDLLRPGDPNVNNGAGVDISGLTVQTYYDDQSDNTVVVTGTIAPWAVVTRTEAYYGIDVCSPGSEPPATADGQLGRPADLVVEAAEALKAQGGIYATYAFWKQFDNDDDGFVDTLWIIHAGRGQEAGGGAEGEDSIWSHSSKLQSYSGYEDGYMIHDNDTLTTTDDLKIGPFTFQPEDSDVGVLTEEFGHNFFDFPDLYTTDAPNSVGWWAHMSAGSWGGELGGTRPVNMPLFFRMTADCGGAPCGWADPVKVLSYTTAPEEIVIGQAGEPAGGTVNGDTIYEGVRIDLPDEYADVLNNAGTGKGAYSQSGNELENTLAHAIDLTGATAPITLTVDAYWDIEEDWDYGYVQVSTDTVNFVNLDDLDGVLRETNPFGSNLGHGLTGWDAGTLRFDVSDYAGESITLRFYYRTDVAVSNPGWWIDNVIVSGGAFSEDFEGGLGGWTNEGWTEVPYTDVYQRYYLVEWRNDNGFDESLKWPYTTNYSDQDEWRVDRVQANVPGAVVMFRTTKYDFSYSVFGNDFDPPSIGSKYGLLVVDTNFWPVERPSGLGFSGRLQSLDAPLALQDQPDFTLEARSQVTKGLLFTETMAGGKGITRFDDSLGYYPGFFYDDPGPGLGLYWWAWDYGSSVVLPSREGKIYSTRITDYSKNPLTALYGATVAGLPLGSGNPGDDNAQYGIHIELLDQASDGSWGKIRVWNGALGVEAEPSADVILGSGRADLDYQAVFDNFGSMDTSVVATFTLPSGYAYMSGDVSTSDFIYDQTLVWTDVISAGEMTTVTIHGRVTPDAGRPDMLVAYLDVDDGLNPVVWHKTLVTQMNPHNLWLPLVLRN